jgi:hypothetical protein
MQAAADRDIDISLFDCVMQLSGIPSVGPTLTSVAVPLPSMSKLGLILGWRGTTVADGSAAGLASMAVRLEIDGAENMITDGTSPAFGNFDCLFPRNGGFMPLYREFSPGTNLQFYFRNLHATNTYTAAVALGIVWETEAERKARRGGGR